MTSHPDTFMGHSKPSQVSEGERERAAALEAELQHGFRNVLAMIRSLFLRTVALGDDLETVASHFQGRLDAVARYQGALAHHVAATVDLELMIRDELRSFQFGDRAWITIDGPEVSLRGNATIALGLAVHELTTNSVKFGVLSDVRERARLALTWRVVNDMLCLRWQETGVPVLGAAPPRYGFGREYIEQGLPYQIAANTTFRVLPGGIDCTIDVPLSGFEPEQSPRTDTASAQ